MATILKFPTKKVDVDKKSDLSDRLERIKASLARIDSLTKELKQLSEKGMDNVDSSKR